jgi:hypothetical protein
MMTLILIGVGAGGCSLSRNDGAFAKMDDNEVTGSVGAAQATGPAPMAQAYSSEGRTCRDFLASYVNGRSESWLQGAACQSGQGRWEIHTLKPWRRG